MPVLDLSDCYGRPFDAYVRLLPVMHAPRDAALRNRWGVIARQLQQAESDGQKLVATDAWRLLMRDIRDAVRRRDGLHRANIAATVLPQVLLAGCGTVDKALKAIAREMRTMGKTGASHATLEHAWSEFRSVSHVWAVFTVLGLSPGKPLLIQDMLDMFSVAEAFRYRGWPTRRATRGRFSTPTRPGRSTIPRGRSSPPPRTSRASISLFKCARS